MYTYSTPIYHFVNTMKLLISLLALLLLWSTAFAFECRDGWRWANWECNMPNGSKYAFYEEKVCNTVSIKVEDLEWKGILKSQVQSSQESITSLRTSVSQANDKEQAILKQIADLQSQLADIGREKQTLSSTIDNETVRLNVLLNTRIPRLTKTDSQCSMVEKFKLLPGNLPWTGAGRRK